MLSGFIEPEPPVPVCTDFVMISLQVWVHSEINCSYFKFIKSDFGEEGSFSFSVSKIRLILFKPVGTQGTVGSHGNIKVCYIAALSLKKCHHIICCLS